VHTESLAFALCPLSDVAFAFLAFPNAIPVLEPFPPFSFVGLAGGPGVESLSMRFVFKVLTVVLPAIRKYFKAVARTLIIQPLAFINPTRSLVDQNAEAFPLSLAIELASVQTILILLDSE
jgi:hypothetical protein